MEGWKGGRVEEGKSSDVGAVLYQINQIRIVFCSELILFRSSGSQCL